MYDAVQNMSDTTASVLFGGTDTGLAELHKLVWHITQAQAAADPTDTGAAMWKAAKHPPCEPEMPDLDWSAPMPAWESVSVAELLAEIAA
jgi:hypothetical protein